MDEKNERDKMSELTVDNSLHGILRHMLERARGWQGSITCDGMQGLIRNTKNQIEHSLLELVPKVNKEKDYSPPEEEQQADEIIRHFTMIIKQFCEGNE